MAKESWRNTQSDLQRHTGRLLMMLQLPELAVKDIRPTIKLSSAKEVTRELLDFPARGMRKMAIAGFTQCDHFLMASSPTAERWGASTVRTTRCEGDAELEATLTGEAEAVFRDVLGHPLVLFAHEEEPA